VDTLAVKPCFPVAEAEEELYLGVYGDTHGDERASVNQFTAHVEALEKRVLSAIVPDPGIFCGTQIIPLKDKLYWPFGRTSVPLADLRERQLAENQLLTLLAFDALQLHQTFNVNPKKHTFSEARLAIGKQETSNVRGEVHKHKLPDDLNRDREASDTGQRACPLAIDRYCRRLMIPQTPADDIYGLNTLPQA
jgi:hypothetical protein